MPTTLLPAPHPDFQIFYRLCNGLNSLSERTSREMGRASYSLSSRVGICNFGTTQLRLLQIILLPVHCGRRPLQNRILISLFFRLRVQCCIPYSREFECALLIRKSTFWQKVTVHED